jgi:single-strand DNA-binding protein
MTGAAKVERGAGEAAEVPTRNEVLLVGRVSGAPVERELPSGSVVVSWRVVVDRPPAAAPAGVRTATVDTFDCIAWTPRTRRSARALLDGDVVQVEGSLRRRFWRVGAGSASRCELEAASLRRLRRPVAAAG